MSEVFGRTHLHELVQIVGHALKEEEESLREPLLSKPIYRTNGVAGLYRADNEHFYQYIAWKALVKSDFPFAVIPEFDKRDLWFCRDVIHRERVAIGEMKRWVSTSGKLELPGIRLDIEARQKDGCAGFILLTTVQAPSNRQTNLGFLADNLADMGVTQSDFEDFYFPTVRRDSDATKELEFGLIGFMVATGTNT